MHRRTWDSSRGAVRPTRVMSRESVHLSDLEALVLLSEHRSLREIGRIHGRTPSSVGKALKRAEKSLGVRLTERREGALKLTDTGLRIASSARLILVSWNKLKVHGV